MNERGKGRTSLATVTHARLRADQGDASGARRILRRILEADPGDEDARRLLREIGGRADRPRVVERPEPLAPRVPGDPSRLAARFRGALAPGPSTRRQRIERLRTWLETVQRNRAGGSDA